MKTAAEIIKERRVKLGISQKRLSDMSGVSLNTILNIEGGKVTGRFETVLKLCEALGIRITFGTEEKEFENGSYLRRKSESCN